LFYKQLQRFPYSYDEWYGFEQHQIAHEAVAQKLEASDAAKFRELSNQLEDFK
jgi:hypothetical protein